MRPHAPPESTLKNPMDLTAAAGEAGDRRAVELVMKVPNVDAVTVIYVPPVPTEEIAVAKAIVEASRGSDKTLLCNFLGRSENSPGFVHLVENNIPSYLFPAGAARRTRGSARGGGGGAGAAREIASPVVLRAVGPALVHKTEYGAVALD